MIVRMDGELFSDYDRRPTRTSRTLKGMIDRGGAIGEADSRKGTRDIICVPLWLNGRNGGYL